MLIACGVLQRIAPCLQSLIAVENRSMPRQTIAEPSPIGLRKIELLSKLPPAELDQLAHDCRWHRYSPSQQVLSRDSADRDVYLIISGRVRATAFSAAGRQVTYRDIAAGDW